MTDVTVRNHGTIVQVFLETDAAQDWVGANVDVEGGFQPGLPGYLVVEPRYVTELVDGMASDGLSVAVAP